MKTKILAANYTNGTNVKEIKGKNIRGYSCHSWQESAFSMYHLAALSKPDFIENCG